MDAAADYDAVNITFSEINAHIDSQWVAIRNNEPVTVDLMQWNNGNLLVLGTADVPAGLYSQIRVKIDSASIVVNGNPYDVKVPSDAQSWLKFDADFMVKAGSTYEAVLDFDAQRSVVSTGPPDNPTGYLLKPVARVEEKTQTGSLSGKVKNPQGSPVAFAIAGGDTVTSSKVDDSGFFRLAFLPSGVYTVKIRDTNELTYSKAVAAVVSGVENHLGDITLE